MSDQTPDPHDDLLRDALQAEAEGVAATPELLERIRAAAAVPSRRPAGRWLLVAAAVALVAGLGVTLLSRDDGSVVDTLDDPSSTTTSSTEPPADIYDALAGAFPCGAEGGAQTAFYLDPTATAAEIDAVTAALDADARVQRVRVIPQAEVAAALDEVAPGADWDPASIPSAVLATSASSEDDLAIRGIVSDLPGVRASSSTDCGGSETPTSERPAIAVAVTEDARLVVIDVETGAEVRELVALDDPTATTTEVVEGGLYTITGVALHPNGRDVYYETCCEPAAGAVFRVPIDGSAEPEYVTAAYGIDLSADGRWLVGVSGGAGLTVYDIETGTGALLQDEGAFEWEQAAVNADGTEVAILVATRDAEGAVLSRAVERYAVEGDRLGDLLGTTEGDQGIAPLFTTDTSRPGVVSTFALDVNVDASGRWVLRVDSQGYLGVVTQGSQAVVISDGRFLAADW